MWFKGQSWLFVRREQRRKKGSPKPFKVQRREDDQKKQGESWEFIVRWQWHAREPRNCSVSSYSLVLFEEWSPRWDHVP